MVFPFLFFALSPHFWLPLSETSSSPSLRANPLPTTLTTAFYISFPKITHTTSKTPDQSLSATPSIESSPKSSPTPSPQPPSIFILHSSRKGFVPGRSGHDHIKDITKQFYSSLGRNEQLFILFLDTKKAFDSIDHDFIFLALEKLGFPPWFVLAVGGLMKHGMVFPAIARSTNPSVGIPINRGVKQGCPLSPLLFALCYDFLLRKQATEGHAGLFAFADDLAITNPLRDGITRALTTICRFARFSGLGLNIHKTVILSALPPTRVDRAYFKLTGFHKVKLVNRAIYLGVLIGNNITTLDIFREAKIKFEKRVNLFSRYLHRVSLHKRILIFNIYLLPILYYLAQFYIIPYREVILPIKTITRKAILASNGNSMSYCHLVAPRKEGGPYAPLRDLWSTNMALLGQDFEYCDSHRRKTPNMKEFAHVTDPDHDTLLIEDHQNYAAFVYLEDHNSRSPSGRIITNYFTGNSKKTRSILYRELCTSGYWQDRVSCESSFPTSTHNKLRRLASHLCIIPTEPHTIINRLREKISTIAGPAKWNHHIRLIYNALPTERRRLNANMEVPSRLIDLTVHPLPSQHPCYFCGSGDDSTAHIYFECPVIIDSFNNAAKLCKSSLKFSVSNILLINNNITETLDVALITTFNWSIWHLRKHLFIPMSTSLLPNDKSVDRITDFTLSALPITGKGNKKDNSIDYSKIVRIAKELPDYAIYGFTDGSAINDPRTAGAGIFITGNIPNVNNPIDIHISVGLGPGDNNFGEMVALLLCLTIFSGIREDVPLIIFSDSLTCICYLTSNWKSPTLPHVSWGTRKVFRSNTSPNFRLYWIRGHSNIPGNDTADGSAKKGAHISASNSNSFYFSCETNNSPTCITSLLGNSSKWRKLIFDH